MANHLKGEVELKAGALGAFTLVLDINAMAELQPALGIPTTPQGDLEFLERLPLLASAAPAVLRTTVFQLLQRHHGRRAQASAGVVDIEDAGMVIEAAGVPAVRAAVVQCLSLAFPERVAEDTGPKGVSLGVGPSSEGELPRQE